MLPILLLLNVFASEVTLQNDTNPSAGYMAWLAYPECAISVLTPDPTNYPVDITAVQFLLGSSFGNQEGSTTTAEVGVQLIAQGATPSSSSSWALGPELFGITVSSNALNELSLDDPANGLFPVTVTSGSIAVWVCPPDPSTGDAWPKTSDFDTSGLLIDLVAPS